MKTPNHKFWPFSTSASTLTTLVMFIGLVAIEAILRRVVGWLSDQPESNILIGLLVVSLLPVVLALVDLFIERGGVVKYGGFELDFSRAEKFAMSGIPIPANIGGSSQPLTGTSTTEILKTLKQATSCDVAIIDLEEGHAWWETRLLVLLAGAERLKKPQKVVFVGTEGGKRQQFQGWAHPDELLRCLVQSDEQYHRSLLKARAAGRQWELVEPIHRVFPSPAVKPAAYPWMTSDLAMRHQEMAFDATTELPNDLLTEQLLAADLGDKVESQAKPRNISVARLDDLFRPVLIKEHLDQSWSSDRQIETFFSLRAQYIALTINDKYVNMISKLDVLNEMVKTFSETRKT